MKQEAKVRELLNNGLHAKCLFHFVAESKSSVCLGCVESNSNTPRFYAPGDSIIAFGLGGNRVMCASLELSEFYSLMLGLISLPNRLKFKETIL
jgi:hypothetical protein